MPARPLALLLLPLIAACAAPTEVLQPLPPPASPRFAGSAADVVVVADLEAPAPAARGLVPVLVTVRNNGDRPVRLDEDVFGIIPRPLGEQYAALSPDPPWPEPFLPPVPHVGRAQRDVALPRTVLRPGEVASGYLYFEEVPEPGAVLDFRALIVDAATEETLGTVVLPLRPAGPGGGAPLVD